MADKFYEPKIRTEEGW